MHMYHKADMVLNTLNELISLGHRVITTRTIKYLNDIEKSDKSINNFIWRNLEVLEKMGFLKLLKKKPVKKYELPKEQILIKEVSLYHDL